MSFSAVVSQLLIYAVPVLLAITLHEAAHAYAAYKLGDNTARVLWRVSLNPIRHIDPIGTILMPILLYMGTGGSFVFGYAKPVPVRAGNFAQPKRDMALVAFAGPLSNLLQAVFWLLCAAALFAMGAVAPQSSWLMAVCRAGLLTNLVMFAFNLFPIPPLDGGRILVWLLPRQAAQSVAQLESFGFFIVMGLVMVGAISKWWMLPIISGTLYVLKMLLILLGLAVPF